jgi:hypothetical protein
MTMSEPAIDTWNSSPGCTPDGISTWYICAIECCKVARSRNQSPSQHKEHPKRSARK